MELNNNKTMGLKEAISKYVQDGDTLSAAGFTHLIPFAAGHEIIRQSKRDLVLARVGAYLRYPSPRPDDQRYSPQGTVQRYGPGQARLCAGPGADI